MTRTHDIRADGPMRMPDKWHGVILGNTAGAATEWKAKVKEAVQRADSLATGAMPYGSKSRTAQASGRVLGKARATMQYTVPHDKKLVTKELEKLQKAVTGLVGHESPVSLGVFSRASFAIQPRPRLRTLLDGAGPQAHGVWLRWTMRLIYYCRGLPP